MPPSSSRNRFLRVAKARHFFRLLPTLCLGAFLTAGCSSVSDLTGGVSKRSNLGPEYHQKVGLSVNAKPERISYYGSASSDVSDLMSFHLEQILPFSAQTALQGIFASVEMAEQTEGETVSFKTPDLVGYFSVRVQNIRYDYPEDSRPVYRAEVRLVVEFKTLRHQVIWSKMFQGEGTAYSDTNISLTDFGRGAASALEDAFRSAVNEMEDAVAQSPNLREYLRSVALP